MQRFFTLLAITLLVSTASADVLINQIRPWRNTLGVGGDVPSMVQLYNTGPADVDLSGWHIKSNSWTYPILFWTLPANCYLFVVFDSGTDDNDFSDGVGVLYTSNTISFSRAADECGLYNGLPNAANLVDFVCWGQGSSSFGTAYGHATGAGIWPLNEFVDLTNMTLRSIIARIPSGYDTDAQADWQEVPQGLCDPISIDNPIQLEPFDGSLGGGDSLKWKPVNGATD